MPVSVPVSTKKTKSESEQLCAKSLKLLEQVNSALEDIENIKAEAGMNDQIMQKIKDILPELKSPTSEMKEAYESLINESKHDVKQALLQEKKRQQKERKQRKKNNASHAGRLRMKVKRSGML